MFSQTIFNTPLYNNYSQLIVNRQFEPAAFTIQLGLKDMNLVQQQAAQAGVTMPLGQLLQERMRQLVQSGSNNLDWSAVSEAVKQ